MEQQRSPAVELQEESSERRLRKLTWKWFTDMQAPFVLQEGIIPPWFRGYISRKEAEDLMKDKPMGCFLIRLSDKAIGYILTYRGQDRCRHFVITHNKAGQLIISGDTEAHDSLASLIEFYKTCPIEPFGEKLTTSCFQAPDSEVYDMVQGDMKDRPAVSVKAIKYLWSNRTAQLAPESIPDRASSKASDPLPNHARDHVPERPPNHARDHVPERAPNHARDHVPERPPNHARDHVPERAPNHARDHVPERAPNHARDHVPERPPNHARDHVPERAPNHARDHVPERAPNHARDHVPERTPSHARDHVPERPPNRPPDRVSKSPPDHVPNYTLDCTPYNDCPPALPPKTCHRRAAPTASYDINTPPKVLPRQPRGGAAQRNSLTCSLNGERTPYAQLVHDKSNTKIQPDGGSLHCVRPTTQQVRPVSGTASAAGTVYSELNLEPSASLSSPVLDDSQRTQHPHRQTSFTPPKLPHSPGKRATCQTYSLQDPRERCPQPAVRVLPSSNSLDKLNINPLYQASWEDSQWGPHRCAPALHRPLPQQGQDTYAQVPCEPPPASFLTDTTYEQIPDQTLQGRTRTRPSNSNTYEFILDQPLEDSPHSNTYETVNDLPSKQPASSWGIKADRWCRFFTENKKK